MTTEITVLRGPAPDVHRGTWCDLAATAANQLGAVVTCRDVDDERGFLDAVADLASRQASAVLVPGRHLDLGSVLEAGDVLGQRAVWLSVEASDEPGRTPGGQLMVQGRGVAGLTWCIGRLVAQQRWPRRTIELGRERERWVELRLPEATAPAPVVVLVHGGFWRSPWQLDLMDAVAVDLVARGLAVWNLEYRRPDRHGWEAACHDIATGIRALAAAPSAIDPTRVALLGHSAGAQLVLRAAADGIAPSSSGVSLVVSLAGVLDLDVTHSRHLGEGAVQLALGGTPRRRPDVYASSSPMSRIPIGVLGLVVQGLEDDINLVEMHRRYMVAARAAGDEVEAIEAPGDHFAVIDPTSTIWRQVAAAVVERLSMTNGKSRAP